VRACYRLRTFPMSQSSRSLSPFVFVGIVVGALLLGLLVFSSWRPHGTVTEWTPADHDQPAGPSGPSGPTGPSGQALPPPRQKAQPQPQQDSAALAELAWSHNCANCHGELGRGDGPQGPMLRAPDLTRSEWQARVTDAEILQTIRGGRNNMPKFDLPPAVLDGLVKRIRASRAK
jgi:mono/diheme cytochrome c family protein